MFLFLSKLLPLLIYPAALACILLALALLLRNRPRWRNGLVIAALLLIFLGGNRFVAMASVMSLERQIAPLSGFETSSTLEEPLADAIVVLGGSTREGQSPRPTHEITEAGDRLLYAARLWKAGVAPQILVTGGIVGIQGPAGQPEAEIMTEILVAMGVPEEAILQEDASQNTYQNAVNSKPILAAAGVERIVLVTSAMHMPRSAAIFARQGLDFIPAPTDYYVSEIERDHYYTLDPAIQIFNLIPSAEDMTLTTLAMKEWIGIFIYRLRGWA